MFFKNLNIFYFKLVEPNCFNPNKYVSNSGIIILKIEIKKLYFLNPHFILVEQSFRVK